MPNPAAKPILAVDIDEVLFPLVDELSIYLDKNHGVRVKREDFQEYVLEKVWNVNPTVARQIVIDFMRSDHVSVMPLKGAAPALKKLAEMLDVIVITSRDGSFSAVTNKWILQHFPDLFKDVHLLGNVHQSEVYKSKAEVCTELKVSFLIDDSLENVREVASAGVKCLLFGDYPWNKAKELPKGVKRVKSWEEVTDILL